MSGVVINPGAGDAGQYSDTSPTLGHAWTNMGTFAADVAAEHGEHVRQITAAVPLGPDGGRWSFVMEMDGGRTIEVDMPGIPLEQVRWLDQEGQNIWDYPRLYIDGSSWVWLYALQACKRPGVRHGG